MTALRPGAGIRSPARGFTRTELEGRVARAQRAMAQAELDALLLTTEPEFRYFTGFQSQFWVSPTRPWFLIVPANGEPVAVVPEIGAASLAKTWVAQIHTWPAPRPSDDGVSALAAVLRRACRRHHRLGVPLGHESLVRMPGADFDRLRQALPGIELSDASPLMRRLRAMKSAAEIEKIHHACQLASHAFEALPSSLAIGMSERQGSRAFQLDVLERGVDGTPYLIASSGPGGYDNIIMGPGDRQLGAGDVLVIDTGCTFDGYFCDFDRNFGFASVSDDVHRAYERVHRAVDAGFAAAHPGATYGDVWRAMAAALELRGRSSNAVGRMGHGLGMQLTEWPSVHPDEASVLEPGMVLTLEPGMAIAPDRLMVHEENIVIRDDGPAWLTRRAPAALTMIG